MDGTMQLVLYSRRYKEIAKNMCGAAFEKLTNAGVYKMLALLGLYKSSYFLSKESIDMYSFNVINFEQVDWNFIEKSYDSTCYHSREWITYLQRIGCKPFIVEVKEDNKLKGYFIGAKLGVGIRFIVAPQEGVGTYTQGLCMQTPISEENRLAIYKALANWLFKKGLHKFYKWMIGNYDEQARHGYLLMNSSMKF
ncbi:MAG: hypothetical protein IKT71_08390 [Paludibacteraceae bacterium]|nr:hypothetical protein [Paludibacteraceae bacterium]